MNSSKDRPIIVEHAEKINRFKECSDGLYHHSVGSENSNEYRRTVKEYTIVQTIKSNKLIISKENIKKVYIVWRVQQVLGWQSNAKLKYVIKNHLIRYSDINIYMTSTGQSMYMEQKHHCYK